MIEAMERHFLREGAESLKDTSSPVPRRSSAVPDEFCNVNEMLNQLEMRKSLAEASMRQNSYGYNSLGEEIREVNDDDSSERSDSSA
jgi:hypothetical protein